MKIINRKFNLSFKRKLKPDELALYKDTMKEARDKLGTTGKSVLYAPDTSLPQEINTGIGNLGDKSAQGFLRMMRDYLGTDTVLIPPQGKYFINGYSRTFNPYNTSSFLLSEHVINPKILTEEKFNSLISEEELLKIAVPQGNAKNAMQSVHFGNILSCDSPVENLLQTAFDRLQEGKSPKILQELEDFSKKDDGIILRRVLFDKLNQIHGTYNWEEWPEIDKNLFSNSDGYLDNLPEHAKRIQELSTQYEKDIKFETFKQFVAEESLKSAKKALNDDGIKLIGDSPLAFSRDEIWANQHMFDLKTFVGEPSWEFYSLDYTKMFKDKDGLEPDSLKILEKRIERQISRYDGLRIDAAWNFIQPKLSNKDRSLKTLPIGNFVKDDNRFGSTIVNLIEKTAKRVKGEDYDLSNLLYETEVGLGVKFSPFSELGGATSPLKNRTQIFTTRYKKNPDVSNNFKAWGSLAFLTKDKTLKPNEFLLSTTSHDTAPLWNLVEGSINGLDPNTVSEQMESLQRDCSFLQSRDVQKNFVDAKQAEISLANNQMRFFYDVLGWKIPNNVNETSIVEEYYKTKIGTNYENAYHAALQDGKAFNPMNALKNAFHSQGLDKTHPELYEKICNFEEILMLPEGATKPANEVLDNGNTKNTAKNTSLAKKVGIGAIVALVVGAVVFVINKIKSNKKDKE